MSTKFRDYYQTLGVSRTATAEEIQRAYRSLARKHHPDVNKEAGAEKQFKEISEAYEVLKDPEKRKRYDALGENWRQGQEFTPPPGWGGSGARPGRAGGGVKFDFGNGAEGADFSDFFESLFGGGGFGSSRDPFAEAMRSGAQTGRSRAPRPRQGQTHEAEITISLREAYLGGTRQIALTEESPDGQQTQRTYDVRIPPGVTEGSTIRLSGQGGAGIGGGTAGDLLLRVHLAHDPKFRLDPDNKHDVITTVPIAPWEAVLGAKIPVDTLDGEIVMTLPPGSQSGQRLRVRGKGLPRKGETPGDLYAELRIVVPRQPHPDERAMWEQLAQKSNFDARKP